MRELIEKARMAGDLQQANDLLRESAKAGPLTIGLLHQLALNQMAQQRYGDAMEALLLIVAKHPEEPQLWINIGQCAEALGDWDASLEAFTACLKTNRPEFAARAQFGRGANLFRLGMGQWGLKAWKKALSIPPVENESQFMRAQVTLCFGDYENGWRMYEHRRTSPGWLHSVRAHGVDVDNLPPEWDGQREGRVLVYGEQGAGDILMFSRYLSLLKTATGFVPRTAFGPDVGSVIPNMQSPDSPLDWSAAVGSLPRLFGSDPPIGPMEPEPRPANERPRIGVCWKGNSILAYDKDRSSPIDFRDALQDERWEIVSLQYGVDFKPKDYLETAELMRTLDAVVTVDTSVVHLAGMLGVPTILIPPAGPEWRWGFDETTPWYPSIKIVRRTHVDAWGEALERAKREVSKQVL